MEVDHRGNILASELRIAVHRARARRAVSTGPYLKASLVELAREYGLEVQLTPNCDITVYWGHPIEGETVQVTYRSDWRPATRR